jgi:hypothetical protein
MSYNNPMKNIFSMKHMQNTKAGYTLLFAMIVASIVLALGVSLLTNSRKEFVLSSSAFYAADSGIECANYWDDDSTTFNSGDYNSSETITCSSDAAGVARPVTMTPGLPTGCPTTSTCVFTFYTPFLTDGTSNYSCAFVTVTKTYGLDPVLGVNRIMTQIVSRGYNIGWNPTGNGLGGNGGTGDCMSVSPKKLERGIQLNY